MYHKKRSFCLWVQWEKKIISFHKEDGFEELHFPDQTELLHYALKKSNSGFAIQ